MLKFSSFDEDVQLAYKKRTNENKVVISIKSKNGQRDITAITFPIKVESALSQKTGKK